MGRRKPEAIWPEKQFLTESIEACVANGERLLDDAMQLEFQEPACTKLMLSIVAQEEFAKAFLLFYVREGVLPWSRGLLRAMNDHACKQLVGVILDYLNPEWETIDELKQLVQADFELGDKLPPAAATAVNILRHEKIRRWESPKWFGLGDPEHEPSVLGIAKGKRDRLKQDALYVRLGRDGRAASAPVDIAPAQVDREYEKARGYSYFLCSLVREGERNSIASEKVRAALMALFEAESEVE